MNVTSLAEIRGLIEVLSDNPDPIGERLRELPNQEEVVRIKAVSQLKELLDDKRETRKNLLEKLGSTGARSKTQPTQEEPTSAGESRTGKYLKRLRRLLGLRKKTLQTRKSMEEVKAMSGPETAQIQCLEQPLLIGNMGRKLEPFRTPQTGESSKTPVMGWPPRTPQTGESSKTPQLGESSRTPQTGESSRSIKLSRRASISSLRALSRGDAGVDYGLTSARKDIVEALHDRRHNTKFNRGAGSERPTPRLIQKPWAPLRQSTPQTAKSRTSP